MALRVPFVTASVVYGRTSKDFWYARAARVMEAMKIKDGRRVKDAKVIKYFLLCDSVDSCGWSCYA